MNQAEKIRSQLSYNQETGEIKWLQSGKGRRKNLIAGCVKRKKNNVWRRIVVEGQEHTSGQVAWVLMTGKFPEFIIDHIDGDPLNDSWANLRRGDNCVDQRNAKLSVRNKTGIKGVKLTNGYYHAYIGSGEGQKYLGSSKDLLEACCMRKRAEIEYNYTIR
ncbi:HNH endonuclease [Vibrio splendidus]|nr:HNH endonuclease [Vibrio splendidus]MCC4881865.1 HNH endonuclease [Vibrio splendidus]